MDAIPTDYQTALSDLKQETALLAQSMAQNNLMTKELLDIVKGTNSKGLVTKTELNTAAIIRAWWWLGILSMSILGIAGWVIRGHI